jgi:hypothetical protein
LKKILGWLLLAFVAFYVLRNPVAGTARHLGTLLTGLGTAVGQFLSALAGGR